MQIASAYGKNAAARIEFRDGKVWLTIAPAAQGNNGRKYEWSQKKNFNLDRSELHAMKVVMDTALRRDVASAQVLCNSLFGKGKNNCLFTHVTNQGQVLGGLSLHTDDKGGIYAPFSFRISYYSKEAAGKEDSAQVSMTRINAMMIIRDIEVFNTEYVQNMVRLEMADTQAKERQPGSWRGEENHERGFDSFPGDLP